MARRRGPQSSFLASRAPASRSRARGAAPARILISPRSSSSRCTSSLHARHRVGLAVRALGASAVCCRAKLSWSGLRHQLAWLSYRASAPGRARRAACSARFGQAIRSCARSSTPTSLRVADAAKDGQLPPRTIWNVLGVTPRVAMCGPFRQGGRYLGLSSSRTRSAGRRSTTPRPTRSTTSASNSPSSSRIARLCSRRTPIFPPQ